MVGNDKMLGSVRIDVPAHDHHPLLQEREFFGDYKLTEEDALESANVSALLYLLIPVILLAVRLNLHTVNISY